MGIFNKLFKSLGRQNGKIDVSETVKDVVGGGLIGLAVGELAEEGVKLAKKEVAKKKARKAASPKTPSKKQ